jgi:uncharacterized protein (UPF0332 family)
LRRRIISRVRIDKRVVEKALTKARRDLNTSETLLINGEYDWSLTVSYTAMLGAARALMLNGGYRPSSPEGHVAVVRFMEAVSSDGEIQRFTVILDRLRRKRHSVVYEEYDVTTKDEASQALEWSRGFIDKIIEIIY